MELCSRKDADGLYYFTQETVDNAVTLVRELMKKYNVPPENVIRHYDVTGKICPAPFVGAGYDQWNEFKEEISMKRYDKLEDIPNWATATVQRLMDRDILQGNGQGLDLSLDMVRMLVILDRAGMFVK